MRPENWRPLILMTRILSMCFFASRNLRLLVLLTKIVCIHFLVSRYVSPLTSLLGNLLHVFSNIIMGYRILQMNLSPHYHLAFVYNKALCTQHESLQDSCFSVLAAICLLLLILDPIRPFATKVDLCCIRFV